MKKKEIRQKYDLKKKGVTIAVIGLMLSGSSLDVTSVFAAEEGTKTAKSEKTLSKDARYYSELVESLFVSSDSMIIVEGVDYNKLNEVKMEIWNADFSLNHLVTDWIGRLFQAIGGVASEGIESVNSLFENDEKTIIKPIITQAQIIRAAYLINQMPDTLYSSSILYQIAPMKVLAVKAQSLYNERVSTQVDGLFTDNTQTTLAEGVDQGTIDNLSLTVAELPDGETKRDLVNRITTAQLLLTGRSQLEEAQGVVASLFIDNSHTVLAKGVTQKTIDVAKVTVDQLPEGQPKMKLNTIIRVAQTLLDQQLAKVEITEFETYNEGVSTLISGKFTGKNVKYMRPVVNAENKLLITSAILENGIFSYYLPGLKTTDKVEFVLFDGNYKEVARKAVIITASSTQITKFETYEEGKSAFIRGEFSGTNVKYMRPVVNGVNKELITSATLAMGTFSYYMPGLKATDKIQFILFDANYKEVTRKSVPITAAPAVIEISTLEVYVEGASAFIKGRYSGTNARYMRPIVNGENKALISSATLDEGIFSYYYPGLKVTDNVEFVLFDANYKEITRKLLVVTKE